jgi:hypothetical protein
MADGGFTTTSALVKSVNVRLAEPRECTRDFCKNMHIPEIRG